MPGFHGLRSGAAGCPDALVPWAEVKSRVGRGTCLDTWILLIGTKPREGTRKLDAWVLILL